MEWTAVYYVTDEGVLLDHDDPNCVIGRITRRKGSGARWVGMALDGRKFIGRTRAHVRNQLIDHHQIRDKQYKHRRKNHWKVVDSQ